MNNYFPLLKPHDWVKTAQDHDVFYSFPDKPDTPDSPVVAYAIDRGDTLEYLLTPLGDTDSVSAITDRALSLLRSELADQNWQIINYTSGSYTIYYLAFVDSFHSSECILLKERMLEAHTLLKSERLLACTPQRGMLLVHAFDETLELQLNTYFNVCFENYIGAENEAISKIIWIVEKGEITGDLDLNNTILRSAIAKWFPDANNQSKSLDERSTTLNKKTNRKLFTVLQIIFMTLFGTAIAGLYGLCSNYKKLGQSRNFKISASLGFLFLPLYFFTFVLIPKSPYDRAFPIATACAIGFLAYFFQGKSIKVCIDTGWSRESIKKQLVVIVISLIIALPFLATIIYLDLGN